MQDSTKNKAIDTSSSKTKSTKKGVMNLKVTTPLKYKGKIYRPHDVIEHEWSEIPKEVEGRVRVCSSDGSKSSNKQQEDCKTC